MLRVCDGTEACNSFAAVTANDDSCGLCSMVQFVCPPSGTYSVLTGPYQSGDPFVCQAVAASSVPPVTPPPPPGPKPQPGAPDAGAF
jgi:hypothetical protein